jgi:hypothetical protein
MRSDIFFFFKDPEKRITPKDLLLLTEVVKTILENKFEVPESVKKIFLERVKELFPGEIFIYCLFIFIFFLLLIL